MNEWLEARNKEENPFMQDGEVWNTVVPVATSLMDFVHIPDGEAGERMLDNIQKLLRPNGSLS